MGFESFRIDLRGGPTTYAQADAAVRELPNVRPDPGAGLVPESACYAVTDGRHVIELEVSPRPVSVSCRFTLCHPPSVDLAFLGLARDLMARLGMDARICDDVPPDEASPYAAAHFTAFADAARAAIARRRAEWVAQFGPAQFPASTREVFDRVILPRCEPVPR